MARRKNGALTGHTDIKMRDICVGDYIKVESPLGEKLGWPHEGEEEETRTDELREALAESEEAGVPSEQQPRDLSIYTDEELRSELAARGYRGKLEHTYTVTVTDTLEL